MTAGDGLTLSVVSDERGLQALAPEWDRLVRAARRPSPFLLHDWVTAWWRHFGTGAQLAVVAARRDAVLVGVAPTYIRREWGVRVCRFLGGYESALGDLLLARDDDIRVASALLARLRQLPFDYLDVFGSPSGGVLPRLAARAGLTVLQRIDAPVLRMPQGWDAAYSARVGAKKRSLHRRRLRQLSELGTLRWTTARTPEEVASELEHAFRLHALRWQGRPDGTTFGRAGGQDFHREATRALATHDAVRILTLRIDGRPAAFHFGFVLGDTMYVHRLAFDPQLARFSPGQVTLLHAFAEASAEGVRRVEFLGGRERYKLELADGFEPINQIIGMPSGMLARCVIRVLLLVITARMRLKQNPHLHHLYLDGFASLRRMIGRFTSA